MLTLAQDVIEPQHLQDALQVQMQLLSRLETPLFVTDLTGRLVYSNSAAESLFSWSIEQNKGSSLSEVLLIDPKMAEAIIDELQRNNHMTQELSLRSAKKEPFWVKLTGFPLLDQQERRVGFVFNTINTTQQKASDTLREISSVLVSSLQLDETLSIILKSLEELLKFDSAAIYLLTPNNRLRMVSGRGMPYINITMASAQEIDRFPLDEAVISNKKPLAIGDVRQDKRWTALEGTAYIRSWLGVPLLFSGKPIGLVTVDRATIDPFTPNQISLAETFAGHAAIALQNAELFSHVRKLSNRVVAAQEEERRRISRELHDEMGQALTALKLNLEMLAGSVPPKAQLIERLEELVELADDSLQEVRRLAVDLRPAILDDLGLVPTLRWYQTQFQKRNPINIDLFVSSELPRLSPETETALYRVVQEALTNVSRHSEAQNVEISLSMNDESIYVSIIDDGVGFATETSQSVGAVGVGLIGMVERVEDLQGKIDIISSDNEGTTISVSIPNKVALSTPHKATV